MNCELSSNPIFNTQKNRSSNDDDDIEILEPKPRRKYNTILDEEKRISKQISNKRYREKNPDTCKNAYYRWRDNNPTYYEEKRIRDYRDRYGLDPPKRKSNISSYEQMYRDIFSRDFSDLDVQYNVRPDWLRNRITGNNLEADFLFEEIKLVVEIQGEQHYKYIPYFHRNGLSDFLWQQTRDQIKRELCEKNGYKLIEIDAKNDKYLDVLQRIREYIDRIKK